MPYRVGSALAVQDITPGASPAGSVVKNLPASAGDVGLIPGLGRSHVLQNNEAHVPQLLSLCSWASKTQLHTPQLLKPVCPEPTLSSRRSHCKEKPEHCNKGPAQPKINMHSKDVTFNGEGRREWGGKFSDTSWEDPSHQRDMAWALMVCIPGQNRLARGNLPTPGVVTQARQKRRSQNSLGVWIKNLLKTILRPKQERIIWIKDKAVSSLGLHSTWCALHGPSHPHLY